jgi:hypothetical protein
MKKGKNLSGYDRIQKLAMDLVHTLEMLDTKFPTSIKVTSQLPSSKSYTVQVTKNKET